MSQPAPYSPTHAFLSDEAQASWFPGQEIDVELNNVKTTTDQVRTNLALIQRDDGALYDTGETELYDVVKDPFQLINLAGVAAYASVQADFCEPIGRRADVRGFGLLTDGR